MPLAWEAGCLLLLLFVAAGVAGQSTTCCNLKAARVTAKGAWEGGGPPCSFTPLSAFDVAASSGAAAAWTGANGGPLWLSFAGDSQLRIQFWRLVRARMLGVFPVVR